MRSHGCAYVPDSVYGLGCAFMLFSIDASIFVSVCVCVPVGACLCTGVCQFVSGAALCVDNCNHILNVLVPFVDFDICPNMSSCMLLYHVNADAICLTDIRVPPAPGPTQLNPCVWRLVEKFTFNTPRMDFLLN